MTDTVTSMDRDEGEPILGRQFHRGLDSIGPRQRRPVRSEQHEMLLSVTGSCPEINHLVLAKMEQLLGSHLAQRVDHRTFRDDLHLTGFADWTDIHDSPFRRRRFSGYSAETVDYESGVQLRAEQFDNART